MSLAVNQLIGFGAKRAAAGGFVTDIYEPAGSTPILRAGFSVNESTFDTNTISAAEAGSVTYNASGGLGGGGYVSGLSTTAHYTFTAQNTRAATSAGWLTMFAAVKSSNTGNAGTVYNTAVPLFGDSAGNGFGFGLTQGKLDFGDNTGGNTPVGSVLVSDGNWHLLCFQQISQTDWQGWVDGAKDGAVTTNPYSPSQINRVAKDAGVITSYATALDAVQIFRPSLSDADVSAVFTNAGY